MQYEGEDCANKNQNVGNYSRDPRNEVESIRNSKKDQDPGSAGGNESVQDLRKVTATLFTT